MPDYLVTKTITETITTVVKNEVRGEGAIAMALEEDRFNPGWADVHTKTTYEVHEIKGGVLD